MRYLKLITILALVVACSPSLASNWPQWRGPLGNSVCDDTGLPLVWRENFNLAWKAELPGWGNSTPIIWESAVFVTSQQDDKLLLLRLEKKTGKVLWTREAGRGTFDQAAKPKRGQQVFHRLQNLASPSPVTDGKTVVAHFGNGDLAAYDFDGKQLWKHNLQDDHGKYSIWWGHANSPVIYQDLVISTCMQDSLADLKGETRDSYLVAHDLKTGRQRWYIKRATEANAEECDAYTTPVFQVVGKRTEMLVFGGNQLDSFDPATGQRWWYLPGLKGGRTVTGPTVAGEYLVATRGMRGPMLAMKLSPLNEGKLTNRAVAWTQQVGTPDSCCPAVWADLMFTVTDDGVARCYNGFSGRKWWETRLTGKYKASPITGENRVYFLNEDGLCSVVSASTHFQKLVENQVSDQTIASPAAAGGQIFIRGRKWLYCFGQ
jgi:outer membrane protein assembly factor BamB